MKIGIIGTGAIGANLAQKLVAAGHQVKVTNTAAPEALAQKAQELGASPAPLAEVGQDVDALIISIPLKAIPELPKAVMRAIPADVVVVDTNNYYPFRDGKIEALEQGQIESEWVAEQLGRPVIKAFNNLMAETQVHGGTAPGTPGRLAIAVAGDDARSKALVAALGNDLGFDAVDAGPLAESWRQQPATPVYCTELTAPETTRALADAVPGKAPALRDQIMDHMMQLATPPTRQEAVAALRHMQMGAQQPA